MSEQEGSICAQSEPIVSEVSATDATVLFGVLLNNHSNFHPFLSRFKVVVEKGGGTDFILRGPNISQMFL